MTTTFAHLTKDQTAFRVDGAQCTGALATESLLNGTPLAQLILLADAPPLEWADGKVSTFPHD